MNWNIWNESYFERRIKIWLNILTAKIMFTVIVSLLLSSSFFDVKLAWLLQGSWDDSLFYCAQFKCNASSADLNLHYSFTKHKCFDNLCTSFLLVQAYNPKDIHSDSLFLCQYMYRINIALGRVHIHSQLQQIQKQKWWKKITIWWKCSCNSKNHT